MFVNRLKKLNLVDKIENKFKNNIFGIILRLHKTSLNIHIERYWVNLIKF